MKKINRNKDLDAYFDINYVEKKYKVNKKIKIIFYYI